MDEFVSESILPFGDFDTPAMARGEPGLPTGFVWQDAKYTIVEKLAAWKQSGPEVGSIHGERYLRRHYYRLRMSDGSIWTVYFIRKTPPKGAARPRWFLHLRRPPGPAQNDRSEPATEN